MTKQSLWFLTAILCVGGAAYTTNAADPPAPDTPHESVAAQAKAAGVAVKHDAQDAAKAVKEQAKKVAVTAQQTAKKVAASAQQDAKKVAVTAKQDAKKVQATVKHHIKGSDDSKTAESTDAN